MQNFQGTFKICKRLFISAFSVCMTVPLMASVIDSKYIKMTELKDFTKLVPSQTPSRNSHRRCSVKKDILKNLQNFTGKHLCWSLF